MTDRLFEKGNDLAEINLSQSEAQELIAMKKKPVDGQDLLFPVPGDKLCIPLTSMDRRESFTLDVSRSSIKLTKATYQNRARQAIILIRLDLDGPPHTNPEYSPPDPNYSFLDVFAGQNDPLPSLARLRLGLC